MSKAERTRQYIIEQSASIINKKGISGTSITDLMDATKLAKGGIYGNFENKEEICLEVFHYLSKAVAKGLDSAIAGKSSAKEKLFALIDYYDRQVATSDMGGCPLLNFGLEADDTNLEIRQEVAKAIKRSQQRMARIIEEGIASGEFDKRVNSTAFALKMFSMIEGGIFTSRVSGSGTPMANIASMLKKEIEYL